MADFLHWDLSSSHRLVMEPAFVAALVVSGISSFGFGASQETGPRTMPAPSSTIPIAAATPTHLSIRSDAHAGITGKAALQVSATRPTAGRHAAEVRRTGSDHGMDPAVPSAIPAGIISLQKGAEPQIVAGNTAALSASLTLPRLPLAKVTGESAIGNEAAGPGNLQRKRDYPLSMSGVPSTDEIKLLSGVQDFDLAKIDGSSTSVTRAPGLLTVQKTETSRFASSPLKGTELRQHSPRQADRIVGEFIFHQAGAQINDQQAGRIDVRIAGDGSLSLRLADLLSLCGGGIEPEALAALSSSPSAAEYVTFATMRDAGIDVQYDAANDRIVLSAQ